MNRDNQNSWPPMRIPEITDADRVAGFKDCDVTMAGGHVETMRVYTLEAKRFSKMLPVKSWSTYFSEVVASSLRQSVEFVNKQIPGFYAAEIFLITHRLHSEDLFQTTLAMTGTIGRIMINELIPGKSKNPEDN